MVTEIKATHRVWLSQASVCQVQICSLQDYGVLHLLFHTGNQEQQFAPGKILLQRLKVQKLTENIM